MLAKLFCDGGARGNPGPAGAAAILYDTQGNELGHCARFLGNATNNIAEYQGLLQGLDLAKKKGIQQLFIQLDSELIVKQIKREYKVRHPGLLPLWQESCQKLKAFTSWEIKHIPREQNSVADRLVNQAIDEQADSEA
jgi:ribonuclease HI